MKKDFNRVILSISLIFILMLSLAHAIRQAVDVF